MNRPVDSHSEKCNVGAIKMFGFACAVGGFVTALVLHPPVTSADYAGWVQAFGSIGAIFYALSIASSQRRDANRRDIMVRSSRLAAVRGMTEHAVGIVDDATVALLDRNLAEKYVASYDAAVFEEAFRVLQQIPMLELGTVGAVEGVTLIKNSVSAMSAYLASLSRNPLPILQDHIQVAKRAAEIHAQLVTGRQKVGSEIIRVLNEFAPRPQTN